MKYELEILCMVYGEMPPGKSQAVMNVLSWMKNSLPYLNISTRWVYGNQPPLTPMPVVGWGIEGVHLTPENVPWGGLPPADIALLLWRCPEGKMPAVGGYTWAAASVNARRCVVVSLPYEVPWDIMLPEANSGFASGLELVIAHELKNSVVMLADSYKLLVLNTYAERPPYIECADFVTRKACYEHVFSQFDEETCKIITGGKPEKPPAFDYWDIRDSEGTQLHYRVDYRWDGSKWERFDELLSLVS